MVRSCQRGPAAAEFRVIIGKETTLVLIIALRYVCPVGLWAILGKIKGAARHLVIKVTWRGRKVS